MIIGDIFSVNIKNPQPSYLMHFGNIDITFLDVCSLDCG